MRKQGRFPRLRRLDSGTNCRADGQTAPAPNQLSELESHDARSSEVAVLSLLFLLSASVGRRATAGEMAGVEKSALYRDRVSFVRSSLAPSLPSFLADRSFFLSPDRFINRSSICSLGTPATARITRLTGSALQASCKIFPQFRVRACMWKKAARRLSLFN